MGTATVITVSRGRRFHLTARRQTGLLAGVDLAAYSLVAFVWFPSDWRVALLGLTLLTATR